MVNPTALATFMAFLYYGYMFVIGRNDAKPILPSDSEPDKKKYLALITPLGNSKISAYIKPFPTFTIQLDESHRWSETDKTIVETDVCQGTPDGYYVPARGPHLYHYVKQYGHRQNIPHHQESEIYQQLIQYQDYDKFYFTCKDGRIHDLQTCQSGNVFRDQVCIGISPCIDVPLNVTRHIPDFKNSHYYIECIGPDIQNTKKCPNQQIFYIDSCRDVSELNQKCEYDPNFFFRIDDRRYIGCNGQQTILKSCRQDEIIVGTVCESNACVGRLDGTKIALPEEAVIHAPFRYLPGYRVCKNERVGELVMCPNDWDRYETKDADVTRLPTVFDGQNCVPPRLCENTFLHDNVVVPGYMFQKNVREWQKASFFDATVGYDCDKKGIKRSNNAPPGQLVKKFKFSPACDYLDHVPVADPIATAYYDCKTKTTVDCKDNHFFNGTDCKPKDPRAFSFKGIDMFRLDGLDEHDGWIKTWTVSKNPSPYTTPRKDDCRPPESKYIHGYNVCSHPECEPFAYLSLFKESTIILRNGHFCYANRDGNLIKTPNVMVKNNFDFWNQRAESNYGKSNEAVQPSSDSFTKCFPSTRIKSGFFVQDSTIYRTCDSKQPFLFCPSVLTSGIHKLNEGQWACEPPTDFYLEAGEERTFERHKLWRIDFIDKNTQVSINKQPLKFIHHAYYMVEGRNETIQCNARVKLIYKATLTYPPNAFFDAKNQLSFVKDKSKNVLISMSSTKNALDFAQHKIIPLASEFLSDK